MGKEEEEVTHKAHIEGVLEIMTTQKENDCVSLDELYKETLFLFVFIKALDAIKADLSKYFILNSYMIICIEALVLRLTKMLEKGTRVDNKPSNKGKTLRDIYYIVARSTKEHKDIKKDIESGISDEQGSVYHKVKNSVRDIYIAHNASRPSISPTDILSDIEKLLIICSKIMFLTNNFFIKGKIASGNNLSGSFDDYSTGLNKLINPSDMIIVEDTWNYLINKYANICKRGKESLD